MIAMPKFKFSKLVRDRIVEHQLASGAKPVYRKLNIEDHKHELINKLLEEAGEILKASKNEIVEEIADLQQVIDDLQELHGLNANDVATAQAFKNQKNGAFKQGIYIDSVKVDEPSQWLITIENIQITIQNWIRKFNTKYYTTKE